MVDYIWEMLYSTFLSLIFTIYIKGLKVSYSKKYTLTHTHIYPIE